MGGIGKTTLADKVFNDGYVKHHFHVRVWVTVSQTYDKRGLLIQILESIGVKQGLEEASDSRLRELVHKKLMDRRYLIVIDDIWDIGGWDNLRLFFPHDKNGSRILLTSRITEVAKHANSHGLIHYLGCLNKERSWELLCQKVFHGNEYPMWSLELGMQIVENCRGLPLAVAVIAGVLAKEAWNKKLWEEIAYKTSSFIVGEENGCMETLGLSYNHLPLHLSECFLYLGSFPEDYRVCVKRLIWLWVAEGFIQEDGSKSLEDIAEGYLMDLIDRNLVIVHSRKFNGGVKTCKVHDLVREVCLRKAKEEQFILQSNSILSSQFSIVATPSYKPVRVSIYNDTYILEPVQNLRSILSFSKFEASSNGIAKLLRVLDLQNTRLDDSPKSMELLVHLRYLAINIESRDFLSSICNLWSLQTLICVISSSLAILLPSNISDLVNLRHFWLKWPLSYLPCIDKPMKLQTISGVKLRNGVDSFQKCFPYIKKLSCCMRMTCEKICDFQSLIYLEKLNLTWDNEITESDEDNGFMIELKNHITYPVTLKTLELAGCRLDWSDMSIIQSLPNLQVLNLKENAFEGSCWNTDGQEFPQLKLLKLGMLHMKQWVAYSSSFPCLRQLEIFTCLDLEEIPLEIGDIPTLELIKVKRCRRSVGESVMRIEEEQHNLGNYNLKCDVSWQLKDYL